MLSPAGSKKELESKQEKSEEGPVEGKEGDSKRNSSICTELEVGQGQASVGTFQMSYSVAYTLRM